MGRLSSRMASPVARGLGALRQRELGQTAPRNDRPRQTPLRRGGFHERGPRLVAEGDQRLASRSLTVVPERLDRVTVMVPMGTHSISWDARQVLLATLDFVGNPKAS